MSLKKYCISLLLVAASSSLICGPIFVNDSNLTLRVTVQYDSSPKCSSTRFLLQPWESYSPIISCVPTKVTAQTINFRISTVGKEVHEQNIVARFSQSDQGTLLLDIKPQ